VEIPPPFYRTGAFLRGAPPAIAGGRAARGRTILDNRLDKDSLDSFQVEAQHFFADTVDRDLSLCRTLVEMIAHSTPNSSATSFTQQHSLIPVPSFISVPDHTVLHE
jgi:hypothetical protein